MAANVLNSPQAVEMSVLVGRAFVRMRHLLAAHRELTGKLSDLERKIGTHDEQIQAIFEAIRRLMAPPEPKKRKIGFLVRERAARYGRAKPPLISTFRELPKRGNVPPRLIFLEPLAGAYCLNREP